MKVAVTTTSDTWRGISPATTHRNEVLIETYFTRELARIGMKAVRNEGGMYSPWDLTIRPFNLDTATLGSDDLVRVDVEAKPIIFPQGGIPSARWWPRGVRFLVRKTSKNTSRDMDVYCLTDASPDVPQIIFTNYFVIRSYGVPETDQRGDQYLAIKPKDYKFLMTGYGRFAAYCQGVLGFRKEGVSA